MTRIKDFQFPMCIKKRANNDEEKRTPEAE